MGAFLLKIPGGADNLSQPLGFEICKFNSILGNLQ